MKSLGGRWSWGALFGALAAILAIPGMPKLLPWGSRHFTRAGSGCKNSSRWKGAISRRSGQQIAVKQTRGAEAPERTYSSGAPRGGPLITSVSPIVPTGNQTVVIDGFGFGHHDPYNGCTNFLRVEDVANGWHIGLLPGGEGPCPMGEWPLYVKPWSDNQIVIGGFPGYGVVGLIQGLRVFRVGDAILITVANAQGKGIVNADPNLKGGPVSKFSLTVSDSN